MSEKPKRPLALVVDDDDDDVEIARRALASRFDVEAVPTAGEGLARLRAASARFSVVVLDYRLGDSNALAFLRSARDESAGPPVIVVSGRDDPRVAEAARALGAFAFVAKDDFSKGALLSTALSAIERAPTPSQEQPSGWRSDVLLRMSEGLYAVDGDGVIVYANPTFERLVGHEPLELLGAGLERVMTPEALAAVARCLARGEAFVEVELVAKEGTRVPALLSLSHLADSGGHVAVVRDFRDLRQRIGALEDTNRRLREGLGEVAVQVLHNVGNAVASLEVRLNDLEQDMAQASSAIHALELATNELDQRTRAEEADPRTRDLVELGRDASRGLTATKRECDARLRSLRAGVAHVARALDVAAAIDEARALIQDLARARGVDVSVRTVVQHGLPRLPIPEAGFEQLLLNLLKNGLESVLLRARREPDARREVVLEARLVPEEAPRELTVVVRDTGEGLEPDVARRIFEFGFSTKTDGTGYGLHASAEFVERLGGRIELVSEGPGRGATARVSLPLPGARPPSDASGAPPRSAASPA